MLAHLNGLRIYEDVKDGKGSVTGHALAVGAAEAILTALRERGIGVVQEANGQLVCRGKRVPAAVRKFVEAEQRGLVRYLDIKRRLGRQSRGTGAEAPSPPARPPLPSEYKSAARLTEGLHRDLTALHHTCREAVDRSVALFIRVRQGAKGDPLTALAQTVLATSNAIAKQAKTINERMGRLVPAVKRLTDNVQRSDSLPVHYIATLLSETDRLVKGLPYAQTWLLLIRHQLLPIAAVLDLRRRHHVGVLEARLKIANSAERNRWGEGKNSECLPTEEFPLHRYLATWSDEVNETLAAILPTLMSKKDVKKVVPQILEHEATSDRNAPLSRYGRTNTDGVLRRQTFETVTEGPELRGMAWPEIYRRAATGKMSHLPRAIINDLLDWARKIQRRQKHEEPLPFEEIFISLEADSDEPGLSSKTLGAEDVRLPEPPEGEEVTNKPLKHPRYMPDQTDWHAVIRRPGEEADAEATRRQAEAICRQFVDAHPEHLCGFRVLLSDEPRKVLAKREGVTVKTVISRGNKAREALKTWARQRGYRG